MALEVFKVFGSIFVNTDEADKSLSKTEKTAGGMFEKFSNGAKTAAKVGAGVVGVATGIGAAALGMAKKTAGATDEVDKMSQKIGVSRTAYQEMNYIMSQSGTDINKMQVGMKTLTQQMLDADKGSKNASEAFGQLGISVRNSSGEIKSQEEMMYEVIGALSDMENETERARIASQLFGRTGTELAPLLNTSSESIEEMRQRAHDLGMVLGDDVVDAGVNFTDTLDTLQRAGAGLFNQLGGALMPIIDELMWVIIDSMPVLQDIIQQILPVAIDLVKQTLPPLLDLAKALLPPILKLIEQILPFLMDIIKAVLPVIISLLETLLPPIIQIVEKLLPVLLKLIEPILPLLDPIFKLLTPLIDVLMALLVPLIDLIGIILPPLISLFTAILEMILPPLQKALELVAKILSGAFQGAFEKIIPIVKAVTKAFQGIIDFIKGIFLTIWTKSWETISSVFGKVSEGIKTVVEKVKGYFGSITDFIKNVFIGVWKGAWDAVSSIFSGVFDGIKNIIENIKGVFTGISDFVKNVFTGNWRGAWQGVVDIFKNIIGGIANVYKIPINAIIDGINTFIRGINKIKIPDWVPAVGGRGFNISQLQRLQVGIDYVPYDDMPALLHRGERVLTASEAKRYNEMLAGGGGVSSDTTNRILLEILERLKGFDRDYAERLVSALIRGTRFEVDGREFARMVRAV